PADAGAGSPRIPAGGRARRRRAGGRFRRDRRRRRAPGGRARARRRLAAWTCCSCVAVREFLVLGEGVAKLGPGAVHSRLDRGDGEVEGLCDLLEREVGVVVKEDGEPVARVELGQGLNESRVMGVPGVACFFGLVFPRFGGDGLAPSAVVDGCVGRELPEPGFEGTLAVVTAEIAI